MALRAAALADKRTASAAALADAVAARDQHNLTGDIDDALTSEKLQGRSITITRRWRAWMERSPR
jgi:hypothetical protein